MSLDYYHLEYANKIKERLEEENIRVELDQREEKLGYKMRESVTKKIPIAIILGDKEKDNENVAYRRYGSKDTITIPKCDFPILLKNEIDEINMDYDE